MIAAALGAVGLAAAALPVAGDFAVPFRVVGADGVTVVVLPEPGAGQVTAQWVFDLGAADDPAGQHGLGHLVEHLAFGPLPADPRDYDARLGELGGSSDGWTDRERAGFGAVVPAWDAGAAAALVDLEWARRDGPHPDAVSVDRQRAIVAQELAELHDAPHGRDRVWLDELLWAGGEPWSRHPAAPPTEAADAGAVAARWAAMRARAVLVFAGEVDADAVVARVGGAAVPPRPPRTGPELGEPGCEPAAPSTRWRTDDVGQGALWTAWPVPGRDHPDRVALEALARWIGGARLAVGAGCGELVVERRGGWSELGRHAASLRRALRAVAEHGLDAATLARLRAAQLTELARAHGLLESRARLAGACVLGGRAPDCAAQEVTAWHSLTPADTQGAARRWLSADAATHLAVMPPDTLLGPPLPGMRRWGRR